MADKKLKPQLVPWLPTNYMSVPHDDEFYKLYPKLAECLWPKVDDGRLTRTAGFLALKLSDGIFTVKVVCPMEKQETVIKIDSLVLMFDEVERAIQTGSCRWVATWTEAKRQQAALDKAIDAAIES